MAKTESKTLAIGTEATPFELLEPFSGHKYTLESLQGDNGTVIVFMCNHCPFVIHILSGLVKLAEKLQPQGIQFVGINSNDIETYPDDSPEKMIELVNHYQIPFPYLFDESQSCAKGYQAACTPDIYLFDDAMKLYYHGQFDNSHPGQDIAVTGYDLNQAAENLLNGKAVPENQLPSIGCNIKWKE